MDVWKVSQRQIGSFWRKFNYCFARNSRYPIYTLTNGTVINGTLWVMEWIIIPTCRFSSNYKTFRKKFPIRTKMALKIPDVIGAMMFGILRIVILSRSMEECEDLFYSYRNMRVKNSIDVTVCFNCEKCYDSGECHHSYKLFYSKHSRDCIDSYFLYDCRNCQNCFMCWNLRGKSYCIENIQYTKEEYLKKLKSFNLGSYKSVQSLKKHFKEIIKKEVVHRQNFNLKIYNSDGDYLLDCKNCHNCNTINDSEDCYNCIRGMKQKSDIDANGCWYSELMGNCSSCVEWLC